MSVNIIYGVICHGRRFEKLTFDDLTENRKRHMKDYLVDYTSKEKKTILKRMFMDIYTRRKEEKLGCKHFGLKHEIGLEILD